MRWVMVVVVAGCSLQWPTGGGNTGEGELRDGGLDGVTTDVPDEQPPPQEDVADELPLDRALDGIDDRAAVVDALEVGGCSQGLQRCGERCVDVSNDLDNHPFQGALVGSLPREI